MPAHSVSSQSSAITLKGGAVMAWILRAMAVARATKYTGVYGTWPSSLACGSWISATG